MKAATIQSIVISAALVAGLTLAPSAQARTSSDFQSELEAEVSSALNVAGQVLTREGRATLREEISQQIQQEWRDQRWQRLDWLDISRIAQGPSDGLLEGGVSAPPLRWAGAIYR